jgi:aldose 1-epimerase
MTDRNEVVRLGCGPFELELCPGLGGSITAFRHRGRDVMRPAGSVFFADRDPREASSFPLVPFSNRIAHGRFGFRGRGYELPLNFPPEPNAIHGDGWQHPWTVSEARTRRAVLDFAHRAAGTPLDYRARQTFALDPDGLEVTIEVVNAGRGAMPAGLGLHPYFSRSAGVTLRARLDHVWLADALKLPTRPAPLPANWNFSNPRPLAAVEVDNCFGGWDGAAQIHWPETALTLAILAEPLFGHLVVYVPAGREFFCVEPVSHVNDGFNLLERGVEGTGVRVLAPGERSAGKVRFAVT